MRNIIVEKIEKEIERLLEEMTKVDVNSEDYEALISRVNNLYNTIHKEDELNLNTFKVNIEGDKNDKDNKIRIEENLTKLKEMRNAKIWSGVETGVKIVGIVAPLVFYGIWMNRGLEFEEEGSFTSQTFKGLISKFKPTL